MSETPRPHPSPGPRHAASEPVRTTPRHTRRWFLVGTGAAVLAAGGGVGAAFLSHRDPPAPRVPPASLTDAIRAERALLADLDATTGGGAEVRRVLLRARADHAAHLQTLTALAHAYDANPAEATEPSVRGTSRTVAQLRSAERDASRRAAAAAANLDASSAQLATVLASIAACEATHAELLT